jgi:hypothetical protein
VHATEARTTNQWVKMTETYVAIKDKNELHTTLQREAGRQLPVSMKLC